MEAARAEMMVCLERMGLLALELVPQTMDSSPQLGLSGLPVRMAGMVYQAKGAEAGVAQRAKLGAAARAVEAAGLVDVEEMAGSVVKPAGRASRS